MNALQRTTRNNVYVIKAPAFAAALTRSNGIASANLRGRLLVALGLQDTASFTFSKSPTSGRWYVYAKAALVPSGTKFTFGESSTDAYDCSSSETQDIDASVDGNVPCNRCASTGKFITRVENGKPVGPGGNCYRCAGKGHHTHADRARNLHHDNHFIPSGA